MESHGLGLEGCGKGFQGISLEGGSLEQAKVGFIGDGLDGFTQPFRDRAKAEFQHLEEAFPQAIL